MFFPLLLYALFAAIFIISKTSLSYAEPLFLVGSRMAVAGVVLLLYQGIFSKNGCRITRKQLPYILLLALFSIYLTNICEFWGLKYLTSAKTCFIYSLTPFVSALLAYFALQEQMNGKKWLGLLIGFIGFVPILLSTTPSEALTGHFFLLSWAEIAVMGAATFSAYGWILLKQLVDNEALSPLTANGWGMLIGGVAALLHSAAVESWEPVPVTEWGPFVGCTCLLIVLSNVICYNLYGRLLRSFSATFMSLAGQTTPFFTALFGWFFLDEEVGLSFYLSGTIVLLGLLLFYQQELLKKFESDVMPLSNSH